MAVRHSKVSAKSDGGDATLVRPSDWNATHVDDDPTIYILGGTSSGNAAALAAATTLTNAINNAPSTGVHIKFSGFITYTALPGPALDSKTGVSIEGIGSVTAGSGGLATLEYTGAGSGSFITTGLAIGWTLKHMRILYTNTSFTGKLIDCYGASSIGGDSTNFIVQDVGLWGPHGSSQTSSLVNLAQTYEGIFERVAFNGGGTAVQGARVINVSSVSVANPTVITTTQAHAWTTGNVVNFGGLSTTPTIPNGTQYTITVTGANTFTIPVNVTVVTTGTGYVYNQIVDGRNDATIKFDTCEFRNQDIVPINNIGTILNIFNCAFEPLSSGDIAAITHDPGMRSYGLNFIGNQLVDQTTTNACVWIKYSGAALTVMGNNMAGRQVANDTAILFDENGNDGFFIIGNNFNNMYKCLDFGSTTGHGHGTFLGNAFTSPVAGGTRIAGTLPTGIGFYPSTGSSVPDGYIFNGGTASIMRFDGDTATDTGRAAAGQINSSAEWRFSGRVYAGIGQTAGTEIFGMSGETNAGMVAFGSNANIDMHVTPKGTGVVLLNWPGASSGATKLVGQAQLTTTISPTQLVANTDNWNPTNLAFCREILVDIDAARNLTGIVAQPAGTEIVLSNKTAFDLTLVHDATSTAANRFYCAGAANFTLRQKGSVLIRYNGTASRWQVVAG